MNQCFGAQHFPRQNVGCWLTRIQANPCDDPSPIRARDTNLRGVATRRGWRKDSRVHDHRFHRVREHRREKYDPLKQDKRPWCASGSRIAVACPEFAREHHKSTDEGDQTPRRERHSPWQRDEHPRANRVRRHHPNNSHPAHRAIRDDEAAEKERDAEQHHRPHDVDVPDCHERSDAEGSTGGQRARKMTGRGKRRQQVAHPSRERQIIRRGGASQPDAVGPSAGHATNFRHALSIAQTRKSPPPEGV